MGKTLTFKLNETPLIGVLQTIQFDEESVNKYRTVGVFVGTTYVYQKIDCIHNFVPLLFISKFFIPINIIVTLACLQYNEMSIIY